jgi:N,N'-diacetyllegionaminate synthase
MKTIVIAEAGVNHNGDVELAKELIDVAAKAGADFVKFQSFNAELMVMRSAPKANYQIQTADDAESQFEMLKKLELNEKVYRELVEYAGRAKIEIFSTAFDVESVRMLDSIGQKIFKIPSGEITNIPYLRLHGGLGKKIVLSTGMSNLDEINNAIYTLEEQGCAREMITVLHCTSAYPAPLSDVNLRAMKTMRDELNVEVGYSDHTLGIEVAIAAVALGATVIEKHFTLDKSLDGPDHKASLNPQELNDLIFAIRNVEKAFGTDIKDITESEKLNVQTIRKSIVALVPIKKGDVFSSENLTTKRPGTGISASFWDSMIGTIAERDYEKDEFI